MVASEALANPPGPSTLFKIELQIEVFPSPHQAVTGSGQARGRGYNLEQDTFLQWLSAVPSEGLSYEPWAAGRVPGP